MFIDPPLVMFTAPAPVRTASVVQSTTPAALVLIEPVTFSVPPDTVR